MKETIINIYPITQFILILFAIVGGYSTINNFLHILSRFSKDKLDNKKDIAARELDSEIMKELIKKYPDVSQEYITKPEREQNIENNQEIHDINKRLKSIEKQLGGKKVG